MYRVSALGFMGFGFRCRGMQTLGFGFRVGVRAPNSGF